MEKKNARKEVKIDKDAKAKPGQLPKKAAPKSKSKSPAPKSTSPVPPKSKSTSPVPPKSKSPVVASKAQKPKTGGDYTQIAK
jgi:hypothetical protein